MAKQKISVTQLQRDNILSAKVMWRSIPPENVIPRLSFWRGEANATRAPTCNTLACFGGWCAWWPEFVAQGVEVNVNGGPFINQLGSPAEALFGYTQMFYCRGTHVADREVLKGSDWDVVMNRIDWLIENSTVRLA